MELFDVYPLYNVTPIKAVGSTVFDENGTTYLDLYGGHAVISIGHAHPHYIKRLTTQLSEISFYSNAVQNPLQIELAHKLGALSGCQDYNLFLCNSGAEANENALKMASFITGKSHIVAFTNGFHGRTSAAVASTDNASIHAPLNTQQKVTFIDFEALDTLTTTLEKGDICAVIIEAIQGVGGLDEPSTAFYQKVAELCKKHQVVLIADEVQSGYGRSGEFFAFQHHNIQPDIITIAKGMGNGFPIGGVLLHDTIKAKHGMLGTTFGGNHLACAAGLAVLEVIEKENLMENAKQLEAYFRSRAATISQIKLAKGKGLMLGLAFDFEVGELRKKLIYEHHIFTGGAKDKHVLRILPALNITTTEIDQFFNALTLALT